MLLGLLEPTRGSSEILGCDSAQLSNEHRTRIGYLAESHPAYLWMTVGQNRDHQSAFYPRWNEQLFSTIIDHFRLHRNAKAGSLSRGERAGLTLALTLAPEPEVLILDDPALGLDPVARRWVLEALVFATRAADRTIFFSSHLLDDVERVADRVGIMDRSVLRVACSVDTLRANVRHFALHFDGKPPATLPNLRGLLRVRRFAGHLQITAVDPDEGAVAKLGASRVEELPIGFDDSVIGYLGDNGDRALPLESMPGFEQIAAAIAEEANT
jgi:ABC-2 type transport system ATP-binding protein